MSNKNSERERFKYGICLNEDCPMCKSKEIQKISLRKEFVCSNPDCGQELRECPPPKKMNIKPFIFLGGVIVIVAVIVVAIILGRKASAQKAEAARMAAIEQARLDSIAQAEADSVAAIRLQEEQANAAAEQARLAEVEANAAKKTASSTSGNVDYGKWSGAWKAGKPHGTGTMKYTKQHLIDSRDPQKRTASPGDYIIGEFANGKLVQGVWYDSSNNVKGSIIIGM